MFKTIPVLNTSTSIQYTMFSLPSIYITYQHRDYISKHSVSDDYVNTPDSQLLIYSFNKVLLTVKRELARKDWRAKALGLNHLIRTAQEYFEHW